MNYQDYTIEDFILDPHFGKWVLGEDSGANEFWANLISEHPGKLEAIKEARKLILNIGEINQVMPESKVEKIWDEVNRHIDRNHTRNERETRMISISPEAVIYSSERKNKQSKNNPLKYWWRVAAVFIFALGATLFILRYENSSLPDAQPVTEIVKTNPLGQKSIIYLNDGSEVVLNSGSKLSYPSDFGVTSRKIQLTGEAYFKVAEDKEKPFVVSSEGIETTALGTEFNVRAYDDQAISVALTKGKVRVIRKEELGQGGGEQVTLIPGEGVKYNDDKTLTKFHFNEKEYTSWTRGILYFHNASQEEVIRKLEKWYGVKFEFINESPRKWGYTGEFDRKSLESVLISIGFAMDFSFEIKNDTVSLKYNAYANTP